MYYINENGLSRPVTDNELLEIKKIQKIEKDKLYYDGFTYEQKVVALIREKYSIDEELAIQRQRETKPEEFNEYNLYCEECKSKAKEMNADAT